MISSENKPYYNFLLKSVSILFIDDDPNQLNYYEDTIGCHPLCTVIKASNASNAQQIIQSDRVIHLCILDLGIDDINNDEFYLLRKFSKKIPFIIMSGSADIERAFIATNLGAVGMIAKPPHIFSKKFWSILSEVFLDRKILPDMSGSFNPSLKECCNIIKTNLPEAVSDWAVLANISDAYLRKLWNECFTISPKHVLFLYKIYKQAFEYFNAIYLSDISGCKLSQSNYPDMTEHRRMMNYYMQNKEKLDAIRDKNC